jgi:hypothetical protein
MSLSSSESLLLYSSELLYIIAIARNPHSNASAQVSASLSSTTGRAQSREGPDVATKQAADPEHIPDLYNISEMHPVPDMAADYYSILLQCTVEGGPKARMPICSRAYKQSEALVVPFVQYADSKFSPSDCESLGSFKQALWTFK